MKGLFLCSSALYLCLAASCAIGLTNSCQQLEIQISNNTTESCVLGYHQLLHGNYVDNHSTAPALIWPMHTAKFDLKQSELYGPDIQLEYICGAGRAKIESKQALCFGYAGKVSSILLEHKALSIYFSTVEPSRWYDTHGVVKWVLNPVLSYAP